MENMNDRDYLDKCRTTILSNLQSLSGAPSVQFQQVRVCFCFPVTCGGCCARPAVVTARLRIAPAPSIEQIPPDWTMHDHDDDTRKADPDVRPPEGLVAVEVQFFYPASSQCCWRRCCELYQV